MPSPKRSRSNQLLLLLLLTAGILTACATQPTPSALNPPGFWSGLLHGFTIVFSFIWSIFSDARIYAYPNSGGWYDFGYLWGAATFLGSTGAASRRPAPANTSLERPN